MSAAHSGRARSPFVRDPAGPPFIWAHRGASALAPENSLEAFAAAAEVGADGIELDVRLTADAIPVVIHEPAVYVLDNGLALEDPDAPAGSARRRAVSTCTFAELSSVPVRHRGGRVARLVRLEEVLAAVPAGMWLNVEVKAGSAYDARVSQIVDTCVRRRPTNTLVSSFDHVVLAELHEANPDLPLAALCDARLLDAPAMLATIPTTLLNIARTLITHDDVVALCDAGIAVSVYGRELLEDLPAVLSWPVVGVFLDDPRVATSSTRA